MFVGLGVAVGLDVLVGLGAVVFVGLGAVVFVGFVVGCVGLTVVPGLGVDVG